MAVTHISESEAAREFPSLMEKVRAGDEIRIDDATSTVAVLRSPATQEAPRRAAEIFAALQRRGSTATLDSGFGDDVEAGIRSHEHESLTDPWG